MQKPVSAVQVADKVAALMAGETVGLSLPA